LAKESENKEAKKEMRAAEKLVKGNGKQAGTYKYVNNDTWAKQ
jgi:hypothetical protein